MRGGRRQRRKALALLIVGILAGGLGMLAYATHLLRRSELQTIDARFSIRGTQHPAPNLLLVEIDNATFQELTRLHLHSEFPFPRSYHAQVIDRLRRAGAKVIVMDLEFTHETDVRNDNALIEALARARGKTVLAATEVAAGGKTDVLGGGNLLGEINARAADARLTVDSDGVVRRFAYAYNGLPSVAVAAAEVASGHRFESSHFEHGTDPIDYAGPPGRIPSISYADVLNGKASSSLLRGKIVIVGASAPILQDVHTTATSGSSEMPGPEIWANATSTLLRNAPLADAPGWVNVALIVLLGLAVPISSLRVSRWRSLLDALILAAVFTLVVQLAFNNGLIITFTYPLAALAAGTLGSLAVLYFGEVLERERVRDAFSRFVPSGVVDDVLARTDKNLRLGGVERDCTVLFSDLRGFTTFSQAQPAPRVIEVVNQYLTEMTDAILDAGGTLIAYMGDGIMALFGAPLRQEDHADRAVAAAREMLGTRLERFNAWLREGGFDHKFQMGIGLNSGPVMAGNVGSEQRVEYTAIGDTTNTAARLESMTKDSEAMLFIADSTRERMHLSTDELSFVGEVDVRGRTGKLAVWTIWPEPHPAEEGEAATIRDRSG